MIYRLSTLEDLASIDDLHQLAGMHRGENSLKETMLEFGIRLSSGLDNWRPRFYEFESLGPRAIDVLAALGRSDRKHTAYLPDRSR